jgi:uncharacterized protein
MQNVTIYSSSEISNEYQKVLRRDFDFSDEDVAEIMGKVLTFITLVKPRMKVTAVMEDPDDNIIVECALESISGYIITYDPHLLKLKEYKKFKLLR